MNTPTRRPPVVTPLAPFLVVAILLATLVIAGAIVLCVVLGIPAWTVGGVLAAAAGHLATLGAFRRRRARPSTAPDQLDTGPSWPHAAVAPDASGERFARPHTLIPK